MNWNYAELSRVAKTYGGPEKYIKSLEAASRTAGHLEMIPWMGVTAACGCIVTIVLFKLSMLYKENNQNVNVDIINAEDELMSKIKQFDEHNKEEIGRN